MSSSPEKWEAWGARGDTIPPAPPLPSPSPRTVAAFGQAVAALRGRGGGPQGGQLKGVWCPPPPLALCASDPERNGAGTGLGWWWARCPAVVPSGAQVPLQRQAARPAHPPNTCDPEELGHRHAARLL